MTRTLHIRLGPTDHNDLEDTLAALDAGDDVDPQPSELSVESFDTLARIFRRTNLELLQAIIEHEPESIRELARLVDRHPPEVLDNLNELEDYGLVELRDSGRAKRPVVWYEELDIDIPLGQVSDRSGTDAAAP
jgi:predicted transcriptional regulator